MQIGVYGTGYLATVIAACLADFGTPVTVFDEDSSRVAALAEGNTPFYERNLKDILRRNLRAARLTYSIDLASFAQKSQIIFFAADSYRYIEEISEQIARESENNTIFVIMTPVPVGTAARIEKRVEGLESP